MHKLVSCQVTALWMPCCVKIQCHVQPPCTTPQRHVKVPDSPTAFPSVTGDLALQIDYYEDSTYTYHTEVPETPNLHKNRSLYPSSPYLLAPPRLFIWARPHSTPQLGHCLTWPGLTTIIKFWTNNPVSGNSFLRDVFEWTWF